MAECLQRSVQQALRDKRIEAADHQRETFAARIQPAFHAVALARLLRVGQKCDAQSADFDFEHARAIRRVVNLVMNLD